MEVATLLALCANLSLGVGSPTIFNSYLPVSEGQVPLRKQLETIDKERDCFSGVFSRENLSSVERMAVGHRLVQLKDERKELESQIQRSEALARNPLVTF